MELSEIVASVDIVEYISQYIELEQRGDEWWGLSYFKEENTPSFSVRQNPPFFYDYSSGFGGNIINFIMQYNSCSKHEAVEILKKYAGIKDTGRNFSSKKLKATTDCAKYKRKKVVAKVSKATILKDNFMERYEEREDKLQIWLNEGISKESLDRFQVCYDGFSNRIVYPIRSIEGKIVNIGGRALDEDWKEKEQSKYIYFYPWGSINTMYGYFENLKYILDKREIIVFEGCKSVLLADTWGIKNTVAMLTSHLSRNQLKILAKLGCRVVFALDKEVKIREDKNITILKNYVNVEYLYDIHDLLDEKEAPVDKGKEVFLKLYEQRYKYR